MGQRWCDLSVPQQIIRERRRIVRSREDLGETYILDRAPLKLIEKYRIECHYWFLKRLEFPTRCRMTNSFCPSSFRNVLSNQHSTSYIRRWAYKFKSFPANSASTFFPLPFPNPEGHSELLRFLRERLVR